MDFSKRTRVKIQKEVLATDIPAVVMGKICKNGEMYFYGYGPSRWGINDKISEKFFCYCFYDKIYYFRSSTAVS